MSSTSDAPLLSLVNGEEEKDSIAQTDHRAGHDDVTPNEREIMRRACSKQFFQIYLPLFCAVLLGLVSGSLYGFGRYSRALKWKLQLSQFQIEKLGILLDTGNYIGHPFTGFIYDHYGSRWSCTSAAVVVFVSYGTIHLGVNYYSSSSSDNSRSNSFPHWIFGVSFFMVGLGSGLGYIAGLGSTTNNFASHGRRSLAIAVVASGYGLSSTLVGLTYRWVGMDGFFLLWAILVAVANLVGGFVLAPVNQEQQQEDSRDEDRILNEMDQEETTTIIALQPLIVSEPDRGHQVVDPNFEEEELTTGHQSSWTSWKTVDFWLLFVAFACCTGCGLFVINNVSTMVESIGGRDEFAGKLVIVLSLCNCSGRILMGLVADRMNKITLLARASLAMAVGLLMSAVFASEDDYAQPCLVLTIVLVASAYGGAWVVIVGILTDWFGNDDFGKNYGLIAMGPALSGMAFNTISAWSYQHHIIDDGGAHTVCLGAACYRGTYILTGVAAIISVIVLRYLEYRRR